MVEGDTGAIVEIPVTLTEPSAATVTVDYQSIYGPGVTPPRSAQPGYDYAAVAGTLTFAPGQTAATVPVTVYDDSYEEDDEWIVVAFGNPTNAVMGGYWGLGFGVILDDDPPHLALPGGTIGPVFLEGDAGTTTTATLEVSLSRPTSEVATVDFHTYYDGGLPYEIEAEPGLDYEPASGTVTFLPGETTATLEVTILGDDIDEAPVLPNGNVVPEGIVVLFENPTNLTLRDEEDVAWIFILDDDP